MNYARMILKKMFYPPKWVRIIIPMMSFTALIFIFAMGEKESIQYLYDQFLTHMKENSIETEVVNRMRECPVSELYLVTPEYLMPYLSYIKEHKRLFRTVVENAAVLQLEGTYGKMFRHVFTPILERHQIPEQDRLYIMAFYIRGLMAIITEWLTNDCADSIDHIIAVIHQCVWGTWKMQSALRVM